MPPRKPVAPKNQNQWLLKESIRERILGNGNYRMMVKTDLDFRPFGKKLQTKQMQVLRKSGAIGRKVMKGTSVLNKRPPKKPKTKKYKRDGTLTARWQKYFDKMHNKAGNPPYRRNGQLRDLVYYDTDRSRMNVIVGPLVFRTSRVLPAKGSGAQLLNEGGRARVLRWDPDSKRMKYVSATYGAFPYVGPALQITTKYFQAEMQKMKI